MKMSKTNITCSVLIILLVNTCVVFSLDLSQPLERVRRALLSENPSQEWNKIINQDLSRANVQSYVKSLVPESVNNLQRSLANEDLLAGLVRSYAEDPRIIRAASNNDVQSALDVFNYEIGGRTLVISNSTVVIDVNGLENTLRAQAGTYVKQLYPRDIYSQIIARTVAQEQIRLTVANLRPVLTDKGIPVELLREVLSVINRSTNRSKRDVLTDLILDLLRPQLAAILVPIQTQLNTILDTVVTTLLSLYLPSQPDSPLLAIVTNVTNVIIIRGTEVIVVLQKNINDFINNLINGPVLTSARRRRDADLEFDNFPNLENRALELSHKRVTRDIIPDIFGIIGNTVSGVLLPITSSFNVIVKQIILQIISSQYATIGNIVTIPLRFLLDYIIDIALPCAGCASIV